MRSSVFCTTSPRRRYSRTIDHSNDSIVPPLGSSPPVNGYKKATHVILKTGILSRGLYGYHEPRNHNPRFSEGTFAFAAIATAQCTPSTKRTHPAWFFSFMRMQETIKQLRLKFRKRDTITAYLKGRCHVSYCTLKEYFRGNRSRKQGRNVMAFLRDAIFSFLHDLAPPSLLPNHCPIK